MKEYLDNLLFQQQKALSVVASDLSTLSTACVDISQLEVCTEAQIALAHARDLCDVIMDELRHLTDS